MRQSLIFRFLLIITWASVSLFAQIVMQRAAVSTRDMNFSQNIGKYLLEFTKIGIASGASLILTFVCYKNMSFTEFLFSQSIFYILAFAYAFLVLDEPLDFWKFLAVLLFIPGMLLTLGGR